MKKSGIEVEAVWTIIAILIMLFFAVMSGIHGGGRRSDPVTGYTRGPVCPGDPVEEALSRHAIPSLREPFQAYTMRASVESHSCPKAIVKVSDMD